MTLKIEEINGVSLITEDANKAVAEAGKELKLLITDLIENKNVSNVVLDLSKVDFADSSYLGALVSVLKRLTAVKGDIKILGLRPPVRAMFEFTRLYKVFEIYDNKDDAINSF